MPRGTGADFAADLRRRDELEDGCVLAFFRYSRKKEGAIQEMRMYMALRFSLLVRN